MEGLLRRRVTLLIRRAVTLVPALLLLGSGVEPTAVLLVSQVVLSFGLPFVLVPLLKLTSDRSIMGPDANRRPVRLFGWVIVTAIIALNVVLILGVFSST